MIIPLAVLKPLLKKLSGIRADTIVLDTENGILSAKENNLAAYVTDAALIDKENIVYFFPAKKFLPVINRMSGTLTIHKTDNGYSLVSNKTRVELEKLEHPWKLLPSFTNTVQFKTAALQNVLKYAQIAADSKQDAMTFAGLISLTGKEDFIDGSTVEALATDGKRIAVSAEESPTSDVSILIPAALAGVVLNFDNDTTLLSDSDKLTTAICGNMTVAANKFTSKFPKAKDLFPNRYDFLATFNPLEIYESLGRIQPMVDEESRAIKLEFGDFAVTLQTTGKGGSGRDEVEYKTTPSAMLKWSATFDHKFLVDFFATIKDSKEPVQVCYKTDANFVVFKHENKTYMISKMTPGGK